MSLNRSVPEVSATPFVASSQPDYAGLVKFLVEPFLESPAALRVDCEVSPNRARVWVRLAFDASDKGRVFGRGGRNIQAIRAVLEAAAQTVGYTAHLDIYGGQDSGHEGTSQPPEHLPDRGKPQRSSAKAPPKLRSQADPE